MPIAGYSYEVAQQISANEEVLGLCVVSTEEGSVRNSSIPTTSSIPYKRAASDLEKNQPTP